MTRTIRAIPDFEDVTIPHQDDRGSLPNDALSSSIQPIQSAQATLAEPAVEKKPALPGLDLQRQLIQQKDATAGWKSVAFITSVATIGLNSLSLLGIMMIAGRPISPLVVMSNGVMESLEEQVGSKRNPALIKLWVKDSMTNMYTFKNVLPQEGHPTDPGIPVNEVKTGKSDGTAGVTRKLPTIPYRYTFAIDPGFAKFFRVGLAELIASVEGGQANAEAAYVIDSVSDPKETNPGSGVWKLDIVGSWLISHGGGKIDRTMPMNKTVTVKAVPPIRESEAMALYKDKDSPDPAKMAKNLMQISAAGLRITEIVDLN
jgi:hypothetical protein